MELSQLSPFENPGLLEINILMTCGVLFLLKDGYIKHYYNTENARGADDPLRSQRVYFISVSTCRGRGEGEIL